MIEDIQDTRVQSIGKRLRKTKTSSFKQSISTLHKSADVTSSLQLEQPLSRQCRICLDNQTTPSNELVAPCKCTGTVKYVHDKCFRKWIERQYSQKNKKQQSLLLKNGIQCQLCKVKISLIFNNKYICCNCTKFGEKYGQNPLVFFLFILFFLINFSCTGYLSYNTRKNPLNFRSEAMTALVIIVAYVFLISTAILTVYYFIKDYIVQVVNHLQGYEQKKENKRYSKNQVLPQEAS